MEFQRKVCVIKVGVINAEGPPVPIPNTEVKLCRADNTCMATCREDRSTRTQTLDLVQRLAFNLIVCVIIAEGPPVPIPNTEVKLSYADNT